MSDAPTCPGRMTVSNAPCGTTGTRELAGIWLCDHHYWRVLNKAIEIHRRQISPGCATCAQREEDGEWPPAAAEVIYYVRRVSDGLIKIGRSTGFRRRLSTLRAEHGPLQILLTHRGGPQEERELHIQFGQFRAEGEFFRPRKRLIDWIVDIRGRQDPGALFPGTLPLSEIEALRAPRK